MGERLKSGRAGEREKCEYVLGTHDEELRRLGFQHQVWIAATATAWERARFGRGQLLLDVGCGPGYATLDLARLVGERGHVTAVDVSERFLSHLETQLRARSITNVTTLSQDVEDLKLPSRHFDGAYARWVLCFVKNPAAVLRGVARALKSGGRFVIQDYYQYEAAWIAPEHPVFRKVFQAVDKSWRQRGGNPNIGSVLPELLLRNGFEIVEVTPLLRLGRSSDLIWQWPDTFFPIYLGTLIEMKLLSQADATLFLREWKKRSRSPGAFFSTPPMIEIIAVKR